MAELFQYFNDHPIEFWNIDDYFRIAVAHPTLFILFTLIVLDLITGISATLIKGKGLDSSLAFKGWVKHITIFMGCFLLEAAFTGVGMPFLGYCVSILAYTIYVPSIIGNLNSAGINLPKPIRELFKREIKRKLAKYAAEEEEK